MFSQRQLPQCCSSKSNIALLTVCLPWDSQEPSATAVVVFLSSKFQIKYAKTVSDKLGPANILSPPCTTRTMFRLTQRQSIGAGQEGVGYGGSWAVRPSPRRLAPFALLHPDMYLAPPYPHRGRRGERRSDTCHNGPFPGHGSWPVCSSNKSLHRKIHQWSPE
jgi:hypothetical protein